jgi:hypothetical protein
MLVSCPAQAEAPGMNSSIHKQNREITPVFILFLRLMKVIHAMMGKSGGETKHINLEP